MTLTESELRDGIVETIEMFAYEAGQDIFGNFEGRSKREWEDLAIEAREWCVMDLVDFAKQYGVFEDQLDKIVEGV
jgi:hypothetical protein